MMRIRKGRTFGLLARAMALAMLAPGAAMAQQPATAAESAAADRNETPVDTIVVTGSRIRRTEVTTPAPVLVIDQQLITDRGFVQAGLALNEVTSINPSLAQVDPSTGLDGTIGAGRHFPALFSLGPERTLTLVNGRRMVSSASGIGPNLVDANLIPTGLLGQIEIVQGGGAAVYGSDAIAGVVNYILRDDFEGIALDAQTGRSDRGDYPSHKISLTAGRNFADGRGNAAISLEWSETDTLFWKDRPATARGRVTAANPADTGPDDGIPAVMEVLNAAFWPFNSSGVPFFPPAPFPDALRTQGGIPFSQGGTPLQFGPGGELVPYDPGQIAGIPFASGGDGFPFTDFGALYTGIERRIANLIGHYDLTPSVRLSTELLYGRTEGYDPLNSIVSNTVLNAPATGSGALPFNRFNPFLSESAVNTLMAAHPPFAAGAPLFLSKIFTDLLPDDGATFTTDVQRALFALDGDFHAGDRNYYWTAAASYGRTDGEMRSWNVWQERFLNALNAVAANGEIVCAINADGDPGTNDPECVPLNPFGLGNIDPGARDYVSTRFGEDYRNTQYNFLATIGGELFDLPGGRSQLVAALERRQEKANFRPVLGTAAGLGRATAPVVAQSGDYHTNEASLEFLAPLAGGDFTLPLVDSFELNSTYRYTDHSIAGSERVWSIGALWGVVPDFSLRASRSRNFRAPSLSQFFAPETQGLTTVGIDPCDADRIDGGPAPATRRANCEAEWADNPSYDPLEGFQSTGENFPTVLETAGGNEELRNEVSRTLTYGLIWEPSFLPGLTLIADRVEIDLEDGLTTFATQQFLAVCYDSVEQSEDFCGAFTRAEDGQLATGTSRPVNTGSIKFRGEVYSLSYGLPLDEVFSRFRAPGELLFGLEATHVSRVETSVTGFDRTDPAGTVLQPDWIVRFDTRYSRGPLRLGYTLNYLPSALVAEGATIESTPTPKVKSNKRHSIFAQYELTDQVSVRGGVNNLTDKGPSHPSIIYGDIIGRFYFLGVHAKL